MTPVQLRSYTKSTIWDQESHLPIFLVCVDLIESIDITLPDEIVVAFLCDVLCNSRDARAFTFFCLYVVDKSNLNYPAVEGVKITSM